jgi:hypothetical protein
MAKAVVVDEGKGLNTNKVPHCVVEGRLAMFTQNINVIELYVFGTVKYPPVAVDAKAMDGLPATVVNAGAVPTTLTAMD